MRRSSGRSFARPETTQPDRDARFLHRLRQKCYLIHFIMFTRIAEWFSTHRTCKDIQPLIQHFSPLLAINNLAKTREAFIIFISQPKAQDHAPVREMVQGDSFACQFPGAPPRQWSNRKSQTDAFRAHRDSCQCQPGVVSDALSAPIEYVIFQE